MDPDPPEMKIKDDADIQISVPEYREISAIPGYRLRKPLEVTIFEEIRANGEPVYQARHVLPSDATEEGHPLKGHGDTKEAACDNLGDLLGKLYSWMRAIQKIRGSETMELHLQYLDSIMVPEENEDKVD